MEFQRHTIRKQSIELELSRRLDANAVQNQVAQILQKEILPLLDRYFSTFSLPENSDQIDRLVLDLGTIRLNELETDFVEKVARNLLEQLPGLCNDSPVLQLIASEINPSGGSVTGIESQPGSGTSVTEKSFSPENPFFNEETIEFNIGDPPVFPSDEVILIDQSSDNKSGLIEGDSLIPEKKDLQDASERSDIELDHSEKVSHNQVDTSPVKQSGIAVSDAAFSEEEAEFQQKQLQAYSTQRQLDLLVYFLQTGLFPWWISKPSYESLENAVNQLLLQQPALLRTTLIRWMEFSAVRKRIAATFPEQILVRLVLLIENDRTTELLLHKILKQLANLSVSSTIREVFLEEWLKAGYLKQKGVLYRPDRLLNSLQTHPFTGASDVTLVPNAVVNNDRSFREYGAELVSNLLQLFGLPDQPAFRDEFSSPQKSDSLTPGNTVIEEFAAGFSNVSEKVMEDRIEKNPDVSERNSDQASRYENSQLHEKGLPSEPEVDVFSKSDKIYLNNAGLVLLWPFLQRFFENTGLYNEEGFVDARAAERAVWLLQYIVLGDEKELFEPQLPLNKILTGLEPEAPVTRPESVSKEELELIRGLLEAVTGYVPTWKNLSMEGFRQAYLQREGALSARDGQWLLQVKRETYDILLEKVPWSWQIVRLPWMNQILVVEW